MLITVAALVIVGGTARAGNLDQGCCLPDSSCTDIDPTSCTAQSGVPQPGPCNGALCGGCCSIGDQELVCSLALAENCTTEQQRAFRGPGTNCDDGCPRCCSCTGAEGCSEQSVCAENATCLCTSGCVGATALFDDCADGKCETSGCCDVGDEETAFCIESDPLLCALAQGEFHAGDSCKPNIGLCGPELCCRCADCSEESCQDDCSTAICPAECTQVVTTGTCDGDGCTPTGCCAFLPQDVDDEFLCLASDEAACEFATGTFVPGGTCDRASGQCAPPDASPSPTATASATPSDTTSPTATQTATATGAPTRTPVPEGGSCTDTTQCAPDLACIADVCSEVNVAAPAASRSTLLLTLAVLIGIAAGSLVRLRRGRR